MRNSALLPVTQARFNGSQERMIGQNGEINASNTAELVARMLEISKAIANNEVAVTETAAEKQQRIVERAAALREAYHAEGSAWAEMGAALSYEVQTYIEREGLMRTIFARGTVEEGSVPRIRIKQRNVRAVLSRGPVQVYPQYVRDGYQTLEEFYVTANPRVEEIDLRQGSGDILEDKYEESLEAIFTAEDRTVVKMLRTADNIYNPVTYFSTTLTPTAVQQVKHNVDRWRIPVENILMSMDLLTDLAVGNAFGSWFDPISKWEIVRTGRIGRLFGLNIITDGWREERLRVLNDGEFFVLGSPEYLGGYTDRGPVEARPADDFDKAIPARGWTVREIIAMGLGNAKAVAHGVRI